MKPLLVLSIIGMSTLISGCGGGGGGDGGGGGGSSSGTSNTGPVVTVSVQAVEPKGNALSYEWRSTDGTITNVNAASTTWTLPAGPGLHFAYALVSNGKGGYTERRVLVSTDSIGGVSTSGTPANFDAPAAPSTTGVTFQSVIRGSGVYNPQNLPSLHNGIYLPDIAVFLEETSTLARTGVVRTDARGLYTIYNVPAGVYNVLCSEIGGVPMLCNTDIGSTVPAAGLAINNQYGGFQNFRGNFSGRLVLSDGSPCGAVNEFFGKTVTGRASLLDGSGATIAGPYRINRWGHWGFNTDANASAIRFECEGTAAVQIPAPGTATSTRTVLADTAVPIVTGMSAKLSGAEVGKFLPPPSGGLASDNVPDEEFFLSYKGIDSRLSACQYYYAVGGAKSCDAQGNLSGTISFDDWKRKTKMEPYATGGRKDIVATYINRVDLNLTRKHHSISYGANQLAAYVCNHLGPADETQAAADTAIDNAVNSKNLVACVAMDYGITNGVNGNQPFTRFFIFGPSGELLPSINLDGRREKFVPGVCVACHGGDRYASKFPDDGSGSADIGAHFLPYDSGNFTFSTKTGLTKADQAAAIRDLNMNVLQTGPNLATTELINGWYASGTPTLDPNYLPASWVGKLQVDADFYTKVYASSCRTCHVVFPEALNFDHYVNLSTNTFPIDERGDSRIDFSVCEIVSNSFVRTFSMPNSLRTHNLYWGSAGTAVDQPALTAAFLFSRNQKNSASSCAIQPVLFP